MYRKPRTLFSTIKTLLLPDSNTLSSPELWNSFLHFFNNKVSQINSSRTASIFLYPPPPLSNFSSSLTDFSAVDSLTSSLPPRPAPAFQSHRGHTRLSPRPLALHLLHFPLGCLICQYNLDFHFYADDAQIYVSTKSTQNKHSNLHFLCKDLTDPQ